MDKEARLLEIKENAINNYVPILQDVTLNFIEMLLRIKKPNKILEIGTAVGYSAIKFSNYLSGENSKITTIELSEDMYNQAVKNVNDMELQEKIDIIHADATKYLYDMDETKESFDVIFIDAAKGQYLIFLENAIRLSKPGTLIIADNVLFKGRVLSGYNEHRHRTATNRLREYLKRIEDNPLLKSSILDIGDGLAISIVENV